MSFTILSRYLAR